MRESGASTTNSRRSPSSSTATSRGGESSRSAHEGEGMSRAKAGVAEPLVSEWEGRWETGWTSILPLRIGLGRYPALYLAYYSGDGTAQVGSFKPGRKRPLMPLFDLRMGQSGW